MPLPQKSSPSRLVKSLRAQMAFRREVQRLAEAGIEVFLVHGNHDPASGWSAGLALPEVSELARHANPRITAMAYAGLTDEGRAKLGEKHAAAFERVQRRCARRMAALLTQTLSLPRVLQQLTTATQSRPRA